MEPKTSSSSEIHPATAFLVASSRLRAVSFLKCPVFPDGKTCGFKKLSDGNQIHAVSSNILSKSQLLAARFGVGRDLLAPLKVTAVQVETAGGRGSNGAQSIADAVIEAEWPGQPGSYCFLVAAKTTSSARQIHDASIRAQACANTLQNVLPMVLVPFLSNEKLLLLSESGMNGVDMCGNGTVTAPGRLSVFHTGGANRYPESRPLNNPYRGLSSLVARKLLKRGKWGTLTELAEAVRAGGAGISLSQCSKAVRALDEDRMVSMFGGDLVLREPSQLIDRLGREWLKFSPRRRIHLRLPGGLSWWNALSSNQRLRWARTGESSAGRYAVLGQGEPPRVAVSDLEAALSCLPGSQVEPVPNFADLQLVETREPGAFFDNELDGGGMCWASPLQTWLELQAGDARQQTAARDLRGDILKSIA